MKAAVVVLSDPAGGEESLGRAFNALAAAKDFRESTGEVVVLFQGAGTRWPQLLADDQHPLHGLYTSVRESVAGVSEACAAFFGADAGVAETGLDFVAENHIAGVGGLPSLAKLAAGGYDVITF
jgi:hypothetical protein